MDGKQGSKLQESKNRVREGLSGKEGRRREGKWENQRGGQKRMARPFYFETNAKCSGRSVAQNSVLSVLQPLPDVATSSCEHCDALNTSYLCVLSHQFPKSGISPDWEKEAVFREIFLSDSLRFTRYTLLRKIKLIISTAGVSGFH